MQCQGSKLLQSLATTVLLLCCYLTTSTAVGSSRQLLSADYLKRSIFFYIQTKIHTYI